MHIEWGEKYAVHVRIIDEQHKETIRLFNLIDDVVAGKNPEVELATLVDDTMRHLETHIATEEHYFDEFQYEHRDEHKEAHKIFLASIRTAVNEFSGFPDKVIAGILPIMKEWLDVHTAVYDKKYEDCFHAHGLNGKAA